MAADMLTRGGEGGQNFGKSAYVILEHSLRRKTILRCLDLVVSPVVMAFLKLKTKLNPKTLTLMARIASTEATWTKK